MDLYHSFQPRHRRTPTRTLLDSCLSFQKAAAVILGTGAVIYVTVSRFDGVPNSGARLSDPGLGRSSDSGSSYTLDTLNNIPTYLSDVLEAARRLIDDSDGEKLFEEYRFDGAAGKGSNNREYSLRHKGWRRRDFATSETSAKRNKPVLQNGPAVVSDSGKPAPQESSNRPVAGLTKSSEIPDPSDLEHSDWELHLALPVHDHTIVAGNEQHVEVESVIELEGERTSQVHERAAGRVASGKFEVYFGSATQTTALEWTGADEEQIDNFHLEVIDGAARTVATVASERGSSLETSLDDDCGWESPKLYPREEITAINIMDGESKEKEQMEAQTQLCSSLDSCTDFAVHGERDRQQSADLNGMETQEIPRVSTWFLPDSETSESTPNPFFQNALDSENGRVSVPDSSPVFQIFLNSPMVASNEVSPSNLESLPHAAIANGVKAHGMLKSPSFFFDSEAFTPCELPDLTCPPPYGEPVCSAVSTLSLRSCIELSRSGGRGGSRSPAPVLRTSLATTPRLKFPKVDSRSWSTPDPIALTPSTSVKKSTSGDWGMQGDNHSAQQALSKVPSVYDLLAGAKPKIPTLDKKQEFTPTGKGPVAQFSKIAKGKAGNKSDTLVFNEHDDVHPDFWLQDAVSIWERVKTPAGPPKMSKWPINSWGTDVGTCQRNKNTLADSVLSTQAVELPSLCPTVQPAYESTAAGVEVESDDANKEYEL